MVTEYLGEYATVMDAEMLGVALSFEQGYATVALDDKRRSREQCNCTQSKRDPG